MRPTGNNNENIIVEKALNLRASLAGIASIADLSVSPSYKAYAEKPFYESYPPDDPNYFKFKGVEWREEHKSVLVWALEHPESEPVLDWWIPITLNSRALNGVRSINLFWCGP